MNNEDLTARDRRPANLLWMCSRMANVLLGAFLTLVGFRLAFSGGADWCPFQGMPESLTKVIGGGLAIGAMLLFAARTALIGLLLVMLWVLFWTWTPSRTLWGHGACWQPAIVLGGLFLNMGVAGLSDREGRSQRGTRLMLFFAIGFLAAGAVLWFRG